MKKTPCSIGTYVLKNIEMTRGREGGGYTAELWKGKKQMGTLEDWGDGGGVNPRYPYGTSREEMDKISKELVEDMSTLFTLCKVEKGCLGDNWTYNGYAAMEGFGELLLELTDLVKQSNKVQKTNPGIPIAAFSTGTHWFRKGKDFDRGDYTMKLGEVPESAYKKLVKMAIAKQLSNKTVAMFRAITGKGDWSLSFAEYVKMLTEADTLNTIKLN